MPTNTRESGLETLIVKGLVEQNGYEQGESKDYNREYAVDKSRLFRFLDEGNLPTSSKTTLRRSRKKIRKPVKSATSRYFHAEVILV